MSEVHEIVDGIYRICSLPPGEYPVVQPVPDRRRTPDPDPHRLLRVI
jgi:hypothetical protein